MDISPAILPNSGGAMSSKEFQRSLITYFEEKGILTDLRSYLRVLMIKELKNTNVAKVESNTKFSLSKQAFTLLIAEHLLREKCHYTLSIFSTEVPSVANQIPFSLYENQSKNEEWRFDRESLIGILELMGIARGSNESVRIVTLYLQNKDSLLTCLVNTKNIGAIDLTEINSEGDYLTNILTVLGVPLNLIETIKKKTEESHLKQMSEERKQLEEMQILLIERNKQIKLLIDTQIIQKKENKKLANEIKDVKKRFKYANMQEQKINLRETELREKLEEIASLKRTLENTLSKEVEVCHLKHCTEFCESLIKTNENLKVEIAKLEDSIVKKAQENELLNVRLGAFSKELQNSKLNIDFLNSCLLRSSQLNLKQDPENSSISEDTSENITGEIIKQVRGRLQQLERESIEIDTKFQKLKMNDFVTK